MSRLPGPGETFGRYQLERELGQGGMGVVYAARDTVLGRRVALKIVAPHLARDEEFRTRFAREAATQARLDSAHVVRIYDHGEHDGVLYISTQLVDGVDLSTLVAERGALDPAMAVGVTEQLLAGLADAHRADVVHRDVKPANVLVTADGTAYLCDFGIATTAGQGLTRTGQVIGSLPWMAPERHYGRDAGASGDVYSAGCLFWYALTGAAPYVGSDGEVMRGHLDGLVPQLVGKTPFAKKANAVLLKALAKEPADRYPSAAAMAADLRELAGLAPVAVQAADAAPTTIRSAATRPAPTVSPRRRWAAPVLAVACLLAAVAGGLGVRALGQDDPALAAGATTVDVAGRTVTLLPTRTLSPRPARATAAVTIGPAAPVGEDPIEEIISGGTSGSGAGSTTGSGSGSGSGSGGTARTTTGGTTVTRTQAAAPPADRYRCWNGTTKYNLSDCGWPTGVTGVKWMVNNVTGCYSAHISDARLRPDDHWGCKVTGTSDTIYVERAVSVNAARGFLNDRMPQPDAEWGWSYGRQLRQHVNTSETGWRFGRYWVGPDNAAWFVYIALPTVDRRSAAVDAFKYHCRPTAQIQGVPL